MIFKRKTTKDRDTAIGLDIGTRQIKAVVMRRHDHKLQLTQYAIRKLPATADKAELEKSAVQSLQEIASELKFAGRDVSVVLSCSSVIVCHAEFPRIPVEEVRSALRFPASCMRYLRYDLSGYYLDAVELPQVSGGDNKGPQRARMLVGAATKEEVEWYRGLLSQAKIRTEMMELAALSVVNGLRASKADVCEKEVVLLIDIGHAATTMNFLREGVPLMTRITRFGGQHIVDYLAQMLSLPVSQAEEEFHQMSETVQGLVHQALSPLAQELRSTIDFFERQKECHVTRAYACGGTALAEQLLECLSQDVGVHCECWNPLENIDIQGFNGETPKLMAVAPSLAAAVGVATAKLEQ